MVTAACEGSRYFMDKSVHVLFFPIFFVRFIYIWHGFCI